MGQLQGKYVLTERDISYLSSNTSLSKDDIRTRFDQFLLQHPDGKIAKDDFAEILHACYSNCDIKKIEDYVYRMYDQDRDGWIDFKEFTMVLYMMSSGSPEDKLRQMFRIFDVNNDGVITQLEMTKMVREMFQVLDYTEKPHNSNPISFSKLLFKEMDVDGDGEISKDEFVQACLNNDKFSSILAYKLLDAISAD